MTNELLRLDLGCGKNVRPGFLGVDYTIFPEVGYVWDLRNVPWPWDDNSVSQANMSHILEHFTAMERISVINELYRVLVPRGQCTIVSPHWNSSRALGDPTHLWPPVSEFWFLYLDKKWRIKEAPHTDIEYMSGGFTCDFETTLGYNMRPDLAVRSEEYRQFAVANYKEACMDICATLTSKKKT